MKLALSAAALLTLMGAASAALPALSADLSSPPADADQPCDRLMDQARHMPAGAWAKGVKALEPSLTINRAMNHPLGLEATLADMTEVKASLDDEDSNWTIFIDRLAGTDIYVASDYQGTLHCQSSVFIRAPQGAKPEIIDPPKGWQDGEGPCWTQSADAGLAFGQPAFIEHGAVSQTNDDERIKITPRTATGWGVSCSFSLHFRPMFKRTNQYCGDLVACAAARRMATSIAEAYERSQERARHTGGFWYGHKPSDSEFTAIKRFIDPQMLAGTTEFPMFGANDGLGYSYSGFALFPLTMNGRAYIAAIGHDGVGWRESRNTLLAIYMPNGGKLTPLAGFVIARSIGGLQSATLEK
jgi:hypothetical protein